MTEPLRILTKIRGTGGLNGQVVEDKDTRGDVALFTEIFKAVSGKLLKRDGPYQDEDEATMQLSIFMDEERKKAWGKLPKTIRPF